LAEGVGFEPTEARTSAVFKTAAFVHSATPPELNLSVGSTVQSRARPSRRTAAQAEQLPAARVIHQSMQVLRGCLQCPPLSVARLGHRLRRIGQLESASDIGGRSRTQWRRLCKTVHTGSIPVVASIVSEHASPAGQVVRRRAVKLASDSGPQRGSPAVPESLGWALAGIAAIVLWAIARRLPTSLPAPPSPAPIVWPYDGLAYRRVLVGITEHGALQKGSPRRLPDFVLRGAASRADQKEVLPVRCTEVIRSAGVRGRPLR
jgi:hypothetical protein